VSFGETDAWKTYFLMGVTRITFKHVPGTTMTLKELTPWSSVLLEKLIVLQLGNKLPLPLHFMEPEVSLARSQKPATCTNPETDQSSPRLPIVFLEDPF
jgi:hypothetical protein